MHALSIPSLSILSRLLQNPSRIPPFSNHSLRICSGPSQMASVKVVAEYAKSGRSSCKKCSKAISAKALRLGLVSMHPRGFDTTSWHHLDCFTPNPNSISSLDAITGFSNLESSDQEAVKRVLDGCDQSVKNVLDANEDSRSEVHKSDEHDEEAAEGESVKIKIRKVDEEAEDFTELSSKKAKLSPQNEEIKLETASQISDIKDNYKVMAEYAKSGRSSCKKCSKAIPAKALRLGLVSKNPRGFDATSWHHLDCFTPNPDSFLSLDAITGFSKLESSDQEALKRVLDGCHQSGKDVLDANEDSRSEVHKSDEHDEEAAKGESVKIKLSPQNEEVKLETASQISDIKDNCKVMAEYAKSGRSSCKKCSKAIPAKALRLGLVSKHPRGFDATSWHHLDCFTPNPDSFLSLDAITGFSKLESSDQEALKRVLDGCHQSEKDVLDANEDSRSEIHKSDEHDDDATEGKSVKFKLSAQSETVKLEIALQISDIKDNYKDAKLLPKWKAFETIIFLEQEDGLQDSSRIAAFDFDQCLAKTNIKRIGADAWSLMYKSIPEKLQNLYKDGYKLVIFTNESNIERWKNKRQIAINSKIGRLSKFIERVKVPMQVFIACGISKGDVEDPFRKPKPGMWRIMEQHFNSGISIDMDQSFYVGDAAGRPNDHSDADIKFAEAIGLKFYVPEKYFDV